MLQPNQADRRMFNTLTVFALLIRCPAGNAGEDSNCPFAKFRSGNNLEEKFMTAESLPDEKCQEMLGFHDRCLAGACRDTLKNQGCRVNLPTQEAQLPRKISAVL